MDVRDLGIFETKTHLSEIIQAVEKGARFRITRRGRPVAEIRPIEQERKPLQRGCAANPGFRMAEDFDAPLEDMKDYM